LKDEYDLIGDDIKARQAAISKIRSGGKVEEVESPKERAVSRFYGE
jgi:hypothetical protein